MNREPACLVTRATHAGCSDTQPPSLVAYHGTSQSQRGGTGVSSGRGPRARCAAWEARPPRPLQGAIRAEREAPRPSTPPAQSQLSSLTHHPPGVRRDHPLLQGTLGNATSCVPGQRTNETRCGRLRTSAVSQSRTRGWETGLDPKRSTSVIVE